MEENNKKVSWAIFIAMVSLLIIGIGWNFARSESLAKQVQLYQQDTQLNKVTLASIQTDLVWIKTNLLNLQAAIEKLK